MRHRSRQVFLLLTGALAACDATPAGPEGGGPAPIGMRLEPLGATTIAGVIVGREVMPVPAVRVVSAAGIPMPGVAVSFAVRGGGSIGSTRVETRADGTASPGRWTLSSVAGVNTLTATATVETGQVVFTAIGVPGHVTALSVAGGDMQFGPPGRSLPTPLRLRAVDEVDNGVAGVRVTFEVVEGGGTIDGGTATTDAEGYAESGVWTLGPAYRQSVRATVAGVDLWFTAFAAIGEPQTTLTYIADGGLHEIVPGGGGPWTIRGSGMQSVREVSWSPDGRSIAFEWPEDGWYSVFLSTAADWRPARLAARHSRPSWSPEGRRLAVATGDCVYTCDLYTMNPDPADPDPILVMRQGYFPAWSPDGARIAYVRMSGDDGYHALHVMNADGSGDREIVPISGPAFDHPTWSPDGQSIAYASCQGGTCRLLVVGADGSGARQVLPDESIYSPAWSPDGRWIAFIWVREDRVSYVAYVSPDGGAPMVVGPGKSPAWRPAGPALNAEARR